MIRMQTRTWNNLIIFMMLGMLVLFFVLNQKINSPEDTPAQLLIPHDMQLTRWQSAGIDLQRNGQGQFLSTNSGLSASAINRLLGAWESAVISSIALTDEQLSELDINQANSQVQVLLTTVEYADTRLARDIPIQVIRLPKQTVLQLNQNYYLLLKPDGMNMLPFGG